MGDAQRLVELSGLTNPILKKETVVQIRKKGIKRPIKKLVELLNHPCSQEQIEKVNSEFERKYNSAGDEEGIVKPFLRDEILESMAHNAASIIADGFDVAFKDNLNINSVTGQITVKRDASGNPDSRFLKCAAAEVPAGMPVANESSAFKGSQQGLGRTRKQKKRSKKTLRRRKMRRNMH
jgi:hypothetical protein